MGQHSKAKQLHKGVEGGREASREEQVGRTSIPLRRFTKSRYEQMTMCGRCRSRRM